MDFRWAIKLLIDDDIVLPVKINTAKSNFHEFLHRELGTRI